MLVHTENYLVLRVSAKSFLTPPLRTFFQRCFHPSHKHNIAQHRHLCLGVIRCFYQDFISLSYYPSANPAVQQLQLATARRFRKLDRTQLIMPLAVHVCL
ncbi:hypothetical protein WAI453_011881 [Rhynchosporium graminicola]